MLQKITLNYTAKYSVYVYYKSENFFHTDGELPNCNYHAYIFYKELVRKKTWRMHFTVVQNTTYSKVHAKVNPFK